MAIGDHLVREDGPIQHHGIECPHGLVAEYGGKATGRPRIRMVDRETFARGKSVRVLPATPGMELPPHEVVARACSRIGEDGYRPFENNCEHFANWCKRGVHASSQADGWKSVLFFGGIVVAACVLAKKVK